MDFDSIQTPPQDVIKLVQEKLGTLLRESRPALGGKAQAVPGSDVPPKPVGTAPQAGLFVSPDPLRVYSLRWDSMDASLLKAIPLCWRYLIFNKDEEPIAVADVVRDSESGPSWLVDYRRDDSRVRSAEAASKAMSFASGSISSASEYEPRLLEIPCLSTTVLWLKAPKGHGDVLIPIVPEPRSFERYQLYDESEFLKKITPCKNNCGPETMIEFVAKQQAPSDAIAVVRKTLDDWLLHDSKSTEVQSRLFVAMTPLQVYSMRADQLNRANASLNDASPLCWRYFIVDERDEPIAMADVGQDSAEQHCRLFSCNKGGLVESSGRALELIANWTPASSQAARRQYEPRFLEIPGLNTTALWLKDLEGSDDWLIPVVPEPRPLEGYRFRAAAEFLDQLKPQARKRLESDIVPKGTIEACSPRL